MIIRGYLPFIQCLSNWDGNCERRLMERDHRRTVSDDHDELCIK